MERIVDLENDICIKESVMVNRCRISVIDDNKEFQLSDAEVGDYLWSKWFCSGDYIITYSRGCMINQIPLTITGAYNVKEHCPVDLSDYKTKEMLKNMFICKKGFALTHVLTEINDKDLGLLSYGSKDLLHNYLTCDNDDISREETVDFILQSYPELSTYTNINHQLTVVEYLNIGAELENDIFWFNIMPQPLPLVENPEYRVLSEGDLGYKEKAKQKTINDGLK